MKKRGETKQLKARRILFERNATVVINFLYVVLSCLKHRQERQEIMTKIQKIRRNCGEFNAFFLGPAGPEKKGFKGNV